MVSGRGVPSGHPQGHGLSTPVGGSSNGRTADSDSASLGSNPSPPANKYTHRINYLKQKVALAATSLMLQYVARKIRDFRGVPTAPEESVRQAMQHEVGSVFTLRA